MHAVFLLRPRCNCIYKCGFAAQEPIFGTLPQNKDRKKNHSDTTRIWDLFFRNFVDEKQVGILLLYRLIVSSLHFSIQVKSRDLSFLTHVTLELYQIAFIQYFCSVKLFCVRLLPHKKLIFAVLPPSQKNGFHIKIIIPFWYNLTWHVTDTCHFWHLSSFKPITFDTLQACCSIFTRAGRYLSGGFQRH